MGMGDVIRVPGLSPLFAAALPTFAQQLTTLVGSEMYALGRELHHLPADLQQGLAKDLCIPSCWLRRRPPSTVTALEFDFQTSATELARNFDSGGTFLAFSAWHFFAGMDWDVRLERMPAPDNEGHTLGIFISCAYNHPLEETSPGGATVEVSILAPDGKPSVQRQFCDIIVSGVPGGWDDFFDTGPMRKLDQSRMQKWTSESGDLTVRVKVSDVL